MKIVLKKHNNKFKNLNKMKIREQNKQNSGQISRFIHFE